MHVIYLMHSFKISDIIQKLWKSSNRLSLSLTQHFLSIMIELNISNEKTMGDDQASIRLFKDFKWWYNERSAEWPLCLKRLFDMMNLINFHKLSWLSCNAWNKHRYLPRFIVSSITLVSDWRNFEPYNVLSST